MDRKNIGRYEIVGELGRGAMGAVLRARDPAMGREVALKCILSAALSGEQMTEFRERFYREARAAGALAHPGIVPVFDVGEDDGVPFLVMELVQGRTLDAALKAGERYSLERVCEIGQQLAEALGYAHRHGVIHRDIKPANILMTAREIYGAERPRITDFGVAKLAGGEVTTTGQLLGTPAFMPPEQFTGAPIDGRTDLFALGVILYRMTTGEQPFPGETLTAVSYKVVHTEPISPARLNPAVPLQLEAVILKCLAKSPAARYQTGEELAADLAAMQPAPRASGAYPVVGQETLAQLNVAETIDQVASLRPRQAAATTIAATASAAPVAPTLASGTQTRPGVPQAPTPQPASYAPPRDAAPPVQTFGGTTQAWPVNMPVEFPPAPPATAAPAHTPAAAAPAQTFGGTTRAWPVHAPGPPTQIPASQVPVTPVPPAYTETPYPAAPPARSYTPPAAAPPLPQPVPPSPVPPVPAPPRAYTPASPAAGSAMVSTIPPGMRTYAPVQHPDSTIKPARSAQMESSMMSTRSGRVSVSRPADEPAPAKKSGMSIFGWLIFIALGIGGTWLFLQIRVPQQTSTPGADVTQPAPGVVVGPVDFNPKTLDPNTSAKLNLDLDALPSALQVTVRMDGKTYWSGTAGDHDSSSGLMAPPGRHTLSVVVSGGGAQKASGDISGDFAAKKKMTLTVKLWPQANGTFDPSSDVVVTLQKDLFSM